VVVLCLGTELVLDIELLNADCLVALKGLPDNSVDSVCTDPPSGITILGHSWDHFDAPGVITGGDPKAGATGRAHSHGIAGVLAAKGALAARQPFVDFISSVFTEVHRVLKPGAFGLVWALPRTSAWTATGLENAGFHTVDIISHLFSTGYPKHATALKPSSEHWILIRKEPEGTIAENMEEHGVGALQVAACHFGGGEGIRGRRPSNTIFSHTHECRKLGTKQIQGQKTAERPPDAASPTGWGHQRQQGLIQYPTDAEGMETVDDWDCASTCPVAHLERTNPDASRFFPQLEADQPFVYQSKASQDEKQTGAGSLYWKRTEAGFEAISFVEWVRLGDEEARTQKETGQPVTLRAQGNIHPTIKSLALMGWMIRISTPPGGVTLDPFMGSGTTACAALLGGFRCIGIERDPTYFLIANARLDYTRVRMETLKLTPTQRDLPLENPVPPATGLKLTSKKFAQLVRSASKKR
jgi:site-specific DNA-methyltransferase (adenine-specific)